MHNKKIISNRHAEARAWLAGKKLSVEGFARTVGVGVPTASKWIYSGCAPRALAQEKLQAAFPDCPVLEWRQISDDKKKT